VDTYGFVCANHECGRYRKEVEVIVAPGTFDPMDSRDLDCDCGHVLVPVDLAQGVEQVEPETIRRYKALKTTAVACVAVLGLAGCGFTSPPLRTVNHACAPQHMVGAREWLEKHGEDEHEIWVVRCSDGTVRIVR
jgi:hypothetical protein